MSTLHDLPVRTSPDPVLPPKEVSRRPSAGSGPSRWNSPRRALLLLLRHPMPAAALLAASLQGGWALWLATNGGDMAAQYAWAQFAAAHPGSAYDLAWYGGMHPVSYSVLTPYLMAFAGVRTTGVIAGTLSAVVFARLLMRCSTARPLLPALVGAAALACDTASGRITFAVGVFLALSAILAIFESWGSPGQRTSVAAVLAVLATLASPVDGLFLLTVAPALFLTGRRGAACALAAGPSLVVAVTALVFPFHGVQPYGLLQLFLVLATTLPLALLAPVSWRAVRVGAWTYAVGNLLTVVIPSPIGSNVERLALLFGAAVLLAAARSTAGRRSRVLWIACTLALAWQSIQPLTDLAVAAPAEDDVRHVMTHGIRFPQGDGRRSDGFHSRQRLLAEVRDVVDDIVGEQLVQSVQISLVAQMTMHRDQLGDDSAVLNIQCHGNPHGPPEKLGQVLESVIL